MDISTVLVWIVVLGVLGAGIILLGMNSGERR